jgi:hypothetical protein
MKANKSNIGQTYKVRIVSYKSFRHYGGREITEKIDFVDAVLVGLQDSDQRYIVSLTQSCIGFPKGHKIAVTENNLITL